MIIRLLLIIYLIMIGSLSFAGGELCNKWYNGKLAGFLFWGKKASDAEIIKCVEKVGINFQDLYGSTPINSAASYAHVDISRLKLLRSLGADINIPSDTGSTPLRRAAAGSSNPAVIFYLLSEGADISSQETRNSVLNALIRNDFGLWENEDLRVALGGSNNIELSEGDVGRFAYPVNGKVIREYVEGKTDGIDISAPEGSPVFAAETGVVAAVTTDTLGVPIIVLEHEEDILSVYAGLENIIVKEKDRVFRRQTIGAVGSGDPSFLHFQVREKFKALDPMAFLNPEKNKGQTVFAKSSDKSLTNQLSNFSEDIRSSVANMIEGIQGSCDTTLKPRDNAVSYLDLTANGKIDIVVVDRGSFECPSSGSNSGWCGSAGCRVHFFAPFDQIQGMAQGWQAVEDENGDKFILLGLHGTACDKSGVELCSKKLSLIDGKFVVEEISNDNFLDITEDAKVTNFNEEPSYQFFDEF